MFGRRNARGQIVTDVHNVLTWLKPPAPRLRPAIQYAKSGAMRIPKSGRPSARGRRRVTAARNVLMRVLQQSRLPLNPQCPLRNVTHGALRIVTNGRTNVFGQIVARVPNVSPATSSQRRRHIPSHMMEERGKMLRSHIDSVQLKKKLHHM